MSLAAGSDSHIKSLPQYGFGEEHDFDSLVKSNRFLFRVYTPKETSIADDTDAYFIAPRFNDQVARSPLDLPDVKFPETVVGTYAEVARHMEWTSKASSCYISSSFSFAWAVWEAVKRYHIGVKKDVQIAIIDASALGGRAATAVQLLMKSTTNQRNQAFWKWHRFAEDSQTVLIYGMVPRQAVLASIPLLQILRKLPSYFLRKNVQVIDGNPLEQVAWNYTSRKLTYHQFCKDMSKRFLNCPDDVKLRDSTGGAVRLALSFLRPFFHRVVQDDFDTGISHLLSLAISISEWPGDGWARNYPEVTQIVKSMALALGEELREKYAAHREEISRLQLVIYGLENTMKDRNGNVPTLTMDDVEVDSDGDFEVELEADDPTLVTSFEPQPKENTLSDSKPSLKMSIAVLPRIPVSFQTPITPPESPRNSILFPTATIPLGDMVSTKVTLNPLQLDIQVSEKPASPPLTPPPRSPVFYPPKLSSTPDEKSDDQVEENTDDGDAEHLDQKDETSFSEIYSRPEGLSDIGEVDEDDDDRTEPGDDVPASAFPSPRSSILSVETLCDTVDIPGKRLSFGHSRTVSFDLFGKQSPPTSIRPSRTVSFSEPLVPWVPFPASPTVDPITIPLPPSPALSVESLPAILPSPSLTSLDSPKSSPTETSSPAQPQEESSVVIRRSVLVMPKRNISLLSPLSLHDDDEEDCDSPNFVRSARVTETASYIVTGFLVGAFLTLFLFSTQRKTLLYVT